MYLFVIFVHVFISISSFFYLLKGSFLSVVNSVCCNALLVKNDTNDQKPELQTKVISSCCNCSRRRRHFLWCCCCSCCGHCRLICVFLCVKWLSSFVIVQLLLLFLLVLLLMMMMSFFKISLVYIISEFFNTPQSRQRPYFIDFVFLYSIIVLLLS